MGNSGNGNSRKMKVLIVLLGVITMAAVSVTIWALFFREDSPVLAPDYAPVENEEYAESIPGDSGDKMVSPKGGGSVSLTYSNRVSIDLSDKQATLMFVNPGKSNQDMVIQIVIQDTVVVQSGTLEAGNQVKTLDLLEGMEKKLAPGGYEGKFVVFYYSQENGEKAIVNTDIPVEITVQE